MHAGRPLFLQWSAVRQKSSTTGSQLRIRTTGYLVGIAAFVILQGCDKGITNTDGRALLRLNIVKEQNATHSKVDQGRVVLEGPTPKDLRITPGIPHTIDGLVPGTYTIMIEGLINTEVETFGERTGVVVKAGPPVPVFVTLNSFVPVFTALPSTIQALDDVTIQFQPVTGATGYLLEWSDNAAFLAPKTFDVGTATSATFWLGPPATYWVRVRARNRLASLGRNGPVGQVRVEAAAPASVQIQSITVSGTPVPINLTNVQSSVDVTLAFDTGGEEIGKLAIQIAAGGQSFIAAEQLFPGGARNCSPCAVNVVLTVPYASLPRGSVLLSALANITRPVATTRSSGAAALTVN
jgi:hypothetical protein